MKIFRLDKVLAGTNVNLETLKRILALVVAGLFIFGGYYVWRVSRESDNSATSVSSPASQKALEQSTANWKSYTLAHDKLTFKYPPSWHVSPTTIPKQNIDFVQLSSPDSFDMVIQNGAPKPTGANNSILASEPISFAGQKAFLVYLGTNSPAGSTVQGAVVASDPSDEWSRPTDKNAVGSKGSKGVNIVMQYASAKHLTANGAKTDPAYEQAKLIVRSMSY